MNSSDEAANPGTHPAATDGITLPPPVGRMRSPEDTTRTTLDSPVTRGLLPGTGSVVFGRYRLRHVLGRGGMGVVWMAEDTKLDRTVALKFLPDVIGSDPIALHELKEETRRGLDLAHPNIVRIHDFVDDDEAAAISMEYVNGKTLAELRLAQPHKVFSVAELSPWVREMCDALTYAHTQCQLVHRDLKPANLMVSAGSHLKITDFGIARNMAETLTRVSLTNSSTGGTMLYMSPEQIMGGRPVPTDDIYSIGATLYELLTGKPPFFRGDIAAQVATMKPPLVRERRAELHVAAPDVVPDDWESAIAACLEKDPALRPQSAAELADRLGVAAQATSRIHAPQPRVAEPPASAATPDHAEAPPLRPAWRRKRWLVAALLGASLLLFWWLNRPGEWSMQTYPSGAFVKLGDVTQVAPARFDHLRPGRYLASITLEGYEPRQLEFKVSAGQKVNIGVIKLSRASGNIPLSKDDGDAFEITSVTTSVVPPQPQVGEPPEGCWNLDEVFFHSEYGSFSSNGRHYLLREAQRALKAQGSFKGDLTGDVSPGLHKAIQNFQTFRQLKPTGLLDAATLQALGLTGAPDKADWTLASEDIGEESWWTRHVSGPLKSLFRK